MKKLLLILAVVSLSGCASLMEYIPSSWDVNQAKVITDIQVQARHFDCKGNMSIKACLLLPEKSKSKPKL